MKQGDPITIVLEGQLVLIECSYVADDYVLAGVYRLGTLDEGVAWLKGYHTPNEACVTAARTCQALREKEMGHTGVQGPIDLAGLSFPIGQPLYPTQPLAPGPAPFGFGHPPPNSAPQIADPWPGTHNADPYRSILTTTSNTKGLL